MPALDSGPVCEEKFTIQACHAGREWSKPSGKLDVIAVFGTL